ncbi:uncharacterized protein LOC131648666 [Vicia villosa]|uniref:uncharacterized protein LOC131648666 n=1 Tax=Vicia villosa TaxID=3911 RepID=UPI00273C25A5|nr:uncharacterized protein LOC131648666 [Vicia villosa]
MAEFMGVTQPKRKDKQPAYQEGMPVLERIQDEGPSSRPTIRDINSLRRTNWTEEIPVINLETSSQRTVPVRQETEEEQPRVRVVGRNEHPDGVVQRVRRENLATENNLTAMIERCLVEMAGRNDAAIAAALEAMAQVLANQPNADENAGSRSLATFQRENPPIFKGKHDPDGALEWLKEIERIFRVMDCTPAQKVRYGTHMLAVEADDWWLDTRQRLEVAGEEITWVVFRREFLRKYYPEDVRGKKEIEFLELKQGNMFNGGWDCRRTGKNEAEARVFFFRILGLDILYIVC